MEAFTSLTPAPKPRGEQEVDVRPTVYFPPSVWRDYFITHPSLPSTHKESDEWIKQRVEKLIEEVKGMLRDATDPLEKMNMIDALQRLGVDYHFEKEIDQELYQIYITPDECDELHATALRFRLLRQHRYKVPSDVFNRFRDEQGNFKANLRNDIKGLLSLYEAAYLGTPQEDILDEAIGFARSHLRSMVGHLDPSLAAQVLHALETPLHRRMRRLEARLYISIYQEDVENTNDVILELAKLDFHLLQSIHREEIRTISMWWKELGLSTKQTFTRDRVVECYFWILGVYFEPHYSRARMMMTKVIAFLSVMDDIFDSYGTVDELQQYNDVIQRWDLEVVDQLEEYLQRPFLALTSTIKDFEDELASEKMSYRVHFLKEMIKEAVRAWLEEAKLKDEGCLLPLEDHLAVSLKTTCYQVLACASFVGMGEVVTRDAFDWVIDFPRIVKESTIICRFMDDVVDDEVKTKGKHVFSTVGCYMKEHGTSVEVACEKLLDMVEDAWKYINEEVLNLTTLPMPLVMRILNLARMMETIYRNIDGYTHSTVLKGYITLLLIQPIPF